YWNFVLADIFTTVAMSNEMHILSFVMTESAIIVIYSVFAWTLMWAVMRPAIIRFAVAGATLGLLTLNKPSFAALLPAAFAIVLGFGYCITKLSRNLIGRQCLVL